MSNPAVIIGWVATDVVVVEEDGRARAGGRSSAEIIIIPLNSILIFESDFGKRPSKNKGQACQKVCSCRLPLRLPAGGVFCIDMFNDLA